MLIYSDTFRYVWIYGREGTYRGGMSPRGAHEGPAETVVKFTGRVVSRALKPIKGRFSSRGVEGTRRRPPGRKPPPTEPTRYPPPAFVGLFKDDHDLAVRAKDIARGRDK